MLFIGFAILIAVGLAFLVSADAGSLVGLTEQQTGQLVPLLVILVVIAGGLFARRYRVAELAGNMVMWLGIFGIAFISYSFRDDIQLAASRVFGELMPGAAVVDEARGTATFRGGRNGHFQITTVINSAEITTIFDTGASAVVLTRADAEAAGINTDILEYDVPVSTANGTGRAATVTLGVVEVGGIVRNDVRAFIADEGALETSLLGMTFLSTLNGYSVSGNSLELVD
ncbi:MAG: retropepsin-like aspartic protease family protein [Devosia sp.]